MIQSPSMKNSAWSTACETIRDPMNLQRDFLQYIIHLQKHLTISSPLLPPKYSRSSDWMTLFLIETRNNGSQNNHTVRQKYHITLKVTNDLAEKGVALMRSFNEALVRNEEEKQLVLQMVEYHRNKFPKELKGIKK